MFAVSGLASLLFLGGWHTGLVPFELSDRLGFWGHAINFVVFVGKGCGLVLVMMWMRWSLPRLRIDQVMMTCLKYFLPIACFLLLGVCLWQLLAPMGMAMVWKYASSLGCVVFVVWVGVKLMKLPLTAPAGELPGVWAGSVTPLMRSRQRGS